MPPAMIPLTIGRTLLPELENPEIEKFKAFRPGCRTSGISEDLPVNSQGSKQSKDYQGFSQGSESDNRHSYDQRPLYFQAMECTEGRNAVFGIAWNQPSARL